MSNDPTKPSTDLTPLPKQEVVPPAYDLKKAWKGFSKNQQEMLNLWMFDPTMRYKTQIASKLKMDHTYVNEFLNSPKALEYMRNYAVVHEADRIQQVDDVTFKSALTGTDRDRRLYYERLGLLQKDNPSLNINNTGEGKVQINIIPVQPKE